MPTCVICNTDFNADEALAEHIRFLALAPADRILEKELHSAAEQELLTLALAKILFADYINTKAAEEKIDISGYTEGFLEILFENMPAEHRARWMDYARLSTRFIVSRLS